MSLFRRFVKEAAKSRFVLRTISGRSISTVNTNPVAPSFDDLIYEAGISGDFESVRHLLNRRVVNGCFNTTATFKFLAYSYSYSSELEQLRRILPQTDAVYTRKDAYETLIARLCELDQTDDALILIGDMEKGRFGLSSCTFHPIIRALAWKGKTDEAWRVVESMRCHGVPVDAASYNIFLDAHVFKRDAGEATEVLTKMEEEGMSPDPDTYKAYNELTRLDIGESDGEWVVIGNYD